MAPAASACSAALTLPLPNYSKQVKLCLVVNKMDRLILELCLTPAEAYERLKAIIAHINMIISSFHSEQYISGGGWGAGAGLAAVVGSWKRSGSAERAAAGACC
jgi:translation elongation factor EF-G